MTSLGYSLFDTTLGRCAVVYGRHGIVGVHLPEPSERQSRERILECFPKARETEPTEAVSRAIAAIVALLRGEKVDLGEVELDMSGVPPFHRRVYEAARSIAPGETLTYGELASRVGSPLGARAVGQALGRNPFAIVVPCHRVLAASGRIGGFTASGGVTTKRKMLAIESAGTSGVLLH